MLEISDILKEMPTIISGFGMFVLVGFRTDFKDVKKSIEKLNDNISTLIANDKNKDREIAYLRRELVVLREKMNNTGTFSSVLDSKIKSLENEIAVLIKALPEK